MDQLSPDIEPEIQSPCVWVCIIDADTGYCCGCGRTGDEVAGWIDYSVNLRSQIMETLPERVKTIKFDPKLEARARRRAKRLAQSKTLSSNQSPASSEK